MTKVIGTHLGHLKPLTTTTLTANVLHDHLVGHISTRRYKIATCPKVAPPIIVSEYV